MIPRQQKKAGAGVYWAETMVEELDSLVKVYNVIQVEVMTINDCVQEILKQAYKKTQIHIYTDSKTVIKAPL